MEIVSREPRMCTAYIRFRVLNIIGTVYFCSKFAEITVTYSLATYQLTFIAIQMSGTYIIRRYWDVC